MKQTAVEWLIDEIENHYIINNGSLNQVIVMELKKQAKAMEKEQIIEAANILLYHGPVPGNTAAEQYYNETFKSE